MDKAEQSLLNYYGTIGWQEDPDTQITADAKRFEDLREHSRDYVSKCRLRLLKYIPEKGVNMLDMASGPIQFPEYLTYSKNFEKRYCVDLSEMALESARKKIGSHGVFLHGNFFDLDLKENFFDCTLSLQTIFHIDKDRQAKAVRRLIEITKPEHPVIVVYSNPDSIRKYLAFPVYLATKLKHLWLHARGKKIKRSLYFHAHPNKWWYQFKDVADVKIQPCRLLDSHLQKVTIPNNRLGAKILDFIFKLEDRYPKFFARFGQYPIIILTKKPEQV